MSSELTSQFQKENNIEDAQSKRPKPSPRPRPWSSIELKPVLSPSPAFLEPSKTSKDDNYIGPAPVTPKRPYMPSRGLSLQMPPRDISSSSTANLSTKDISNSNINNPSTNYISRVPLSPKLDTSNPYGSPGSVLPRRSRGMDFSRACTNLHHSTLAEQSSPDSSPVIGGRAMNVPQRKGHHNGSSISVAPDSPGSIATSLWSTIGNAEKTGISSSVGSVNMLDSDTSTDSSDDDDMMGHIADEDTIHMTPQAYKGGFGLVNPFATGLTSSPSMDMMSPFSPAAGSLRSFQRARLKHRASRKSSSSASGRSSMPSPGPVSPPLLKSIESSLNGGYFQRELAKKEVESRRESLSLGTNDLHISDGLESEDGEAPRIGSHDPLGIPIPTTPTLDERKYVIRRAVTRRGNLLPKPKNFARIRAALQEEGSPIDSESKREAEVIRQVRESDNDTDLNPFCSQPVTTASSPNLVPATLGPTESLEDVSEYEMMGNDLPSERRGSINFVQQALRNSAGWEFWNNFDERMRTPPPPSLFMRGSSSGVSDDMSMDTPASSVLSTTPQQHPLPFPHSSRSRSSTPQPPSMAIEITRKIGKRRRDDDLDPTMFKRRAVSPGVSLQNSPILPSSPAQRENSWWTLQSKGNNREVPSGHVAGEKVNSTGSVNGSSNPGLPKRIGFQGMNDTNDGLMNMSIE